MNALYKISIVLIIVASHTSWNMLRIVRTPFSKKYIRNCSSVRKPQAFDERLRRGIDYFLVCEIMKKK